MRAGLLPCTMLAAGAALAQEAPPPTDPLHYAFSAYAGSGIYDVRGRTVQIYRLPIKFTLWSLEEHAVGLHLRLPVTLGFVDFKPSDVLNTGLPEELGTLSFLPGLLVDVQATKNWVLSPFADLGVAQDFSGGPLALVWGSGVESEVTFASPGLDWRFGGRILLAGAEALEDELSDTYGELELGLEATHGLGVRLGGEPLDMSAFVAGYRYFKEVEFMTFSGSPEVEAHSQFEIGVTLGTRPAIKVWKIPVPRLGLSYRFGEDLSAVRLIFGSPF